MNPIRVICDTNLDISLESNIVETAKDIRTIVAYCNKNDSEKIEKLKQNNVELLKIPYKNGVDLKVLIEILGKMKIDSVLIEGGGNINSSALKEKLVDKVYAYIAPKIIGGKTSLTPVTGEGVEFMKNAIILKNMQIKSIGDDYLLTGYVK